MDGRPAAALCLRRPRAPLHEARTSLSLSFVYARSHALTEPRGCLYQLHGAVRCSIPPLAMHAEDGVTAHSSPPPSETGRLRRGDMLGSRWLVRRMLGRGTFSEIYEAYDMSAPRTEKGRHLSVAIKVAREQRSCSMLKTEDAVLRELQGSNCPVAIYVELGRMPRSGLDTAVPSKNACNILYVVMEMLGRNLSEIRKTVPHRRLPVGLVSHLGMQMLDALQVREVS